ncbi:MAG: hypothetical protein JXQ87_13450 [Bacteroidia bacterium]
MAKKATKRELKRKYRAQERDVLLSKSKKKSYIRPEAYKLSETNEASDSE